MNPGALPQAYGECRAFGARNILPGRESHAKRQVRVECSALSVERFSLTWERGREFNYSGSLACLSLWLGAHRTKTRAEYLSLRNPAWPEPKGVITTATR